MKSENSRHASQIHASNRFSRLRRWHDGASGRRRGRRNGRRSGGRRSRDSDWRSDGRRSRRSSRRHLARRSGLILAHAPLVEVVVLAVHVRALRARAQRAARSIGLGHDGSNLLPAPAGARGGQERLEVCYGSHLERRVLPALRKPLLLGARVRTWSRGSGVCARARSQSTPLRRAPTATHLNCAGAVATSVFTHLRAGRERQQTTQGRVVSRLAYRAGEQARTSSPSGARVQKTP